MKWTFIMALLVAQAAIAGAGESRAEEPLPLPRYDIAQFCAAADKTDGTEGACKQREGDLRAKLTKDWNTLPFQKRHFCVTSVRFMRKELRSYSALDQCLDGQGTS